MKRNTGNNIKRIIVSVTNDLVTDNRVHKVCTTLQDSGYNVLLTGRRTKTSENIKRPYAIKRFKLLFNKSALFYAEYNIRLFFFLLFVRADIFLSNDTDTLPANYLAARIRSKHLVFDAHELFPEVPELSERPAVKKIWTKIENKIFPHLKNSYTVCQSISDEYYKKYGIKMEVVRNIPYAKTPAKEPSPKVKNIIDDIEKQKQKGKKIIIYQGAVNIGRGIEHIIKAMPLLPDFIFYVIGCGDIIDKLKTILTSNDSDTTNGFHTSEQVIFTGKIPADELQYITEKADVGVNILENKGLNYYYSLPNRIFDYMRANIPVVSTDFPEIRSIVEKYNAGVLITDYSPKELSKAIIQAIENKKQIKNDLSWESESEKIIKIFHTLASS
ncbi:MAG: glycosyltransferase [Bacteroidales bacterium]|jgi:glycosyltransferase involved in cell wall biosynthesis|nr:glycosyltransferase [Bacteroidales bacterium]